MSVIRIAVITGVSGGIGRATAVRLVADGWSVVGVDRQPDPPEGLDSFIHGDCGDPKVLDRVYLQIGQMPGLLRAVVHNAAILICKPLLDLTLEEWDRVHNTNLRGVFLSVQRAVPLMGAGGSIVNISSVHASATSQQVCAYAASKGGLSALTRALALELAPLGIRVNSIQPGAIDTPMLRNGVGRDFLSNGDLEQAVLELGENHPLGRVGRPNEVAEAVLFLVDELRSSFITGHDMVVDGGALARLSTE